MAELPSEEELAQLPLRAIVAYAARCARRVQPLFHLPDDHPRLRYYLSVLESDLKYAEDFATGHQGSSTAGNHKIDDSTYASATRAADTVDAANAVASAASAADTVDAANAVASAASAADVANNTALSDILFGAMNAAGNATAGGRATVAVAARLDYDRLQRRFFGKPGELGEPIDASESGPLGSLWPDGPPDWYVEGLEWQRRILEQPDDDASEDQTTLPDQVGPPAFVIAWDPELVTPAEYVELVEILGDLVREEGGAGVERVRSRGIGVLTDAGVLQ